MHLPEKTLTIAGVKTEEFGTDKDGRPVHKPVLYFEGRDKGLVLGGVNGSAIDDLYGDDMSNWAGKKIAFYSELVDFNGELKSTIRCKAPDQNSA